MSPDILPGLAAGASAPPIPPGPAATGPPGDAGLSALFASLLTQSAGPAAMASTGAKRVAQAAPVTLATFALPGKPVPITPNPMKPTPPPTAGAAAETQNAMDTGPVSGSRKAKASEAKPGGELPLPEARTIPSAASPAPPVLFIAITPPPAVATPPAAAPSRPVSPSLPAVPMLPGQASAQVPPQATAPPAAPPAQALSVPASPPAQTTAPPVALPVQALAEPAAAPRPLAVYAAVSQDVLTPPALPKTFTLPTAWGGPTSTADVKPAAVTAASPGGRVAAPAVLSPQPAIPQPAIEAPHGVSGPALAVLPQAVAAVPTLEPTVKAASTPRSLSPAAVRLEKTPTASAPSLRVADTVPASATPSAPRPTVSAAAPRQDAVTMTPAQAVAPAPPIRQDVNAGPDVPGAEQAKVDGVTPPQSGPPPPPAKISLKSPAPSADNNTRTQTATANKPGSQSIRSEEVGKTAVNPETAAPVPDQAPAAPTPTLSAAPAPLTRTDRAEVVRQVADAVAAMPPPARPGAASQMTLQLHPRDWGHLQISVRITPAVQGSVTQTVTAHVVAASPQIKAILETGSGDLRHSLRQAGLHLDKLTVTVQAPEGNAKSGMTPGGGHHPGGGGQSQPETRPSGSASQPGTASFASSTGSPQGGRQGGQPPPSQAGQTVSVEMIEEPAVVRDAPGRTASGQVDMRA